MGWTSRRTALGRVAPELRSPLLWLPLSLTNRAGLLAERRFFTRATPTRAGVRVTARSLPAGDTKIDVYLYEAAARRSPSGVLLWIHGGGTVAGHPRQANRRCSGLAADAGILVVAVDYRLAPEHPFPAGLEDCYAALRWVHAQAEALGVDPGAIVVGGDSAGGGLAAALSQLALDRGGPPIRSQLLVSPMLDDRTVLRADHDGLGRFMWTPASNRFAWSAYLGRPPGSEEPRPYAAAARREDCAGLPAAWIGVGDLDLFLPEAVEYARRLEAAEVSCELHVQAGMYHSADGLRPGAPSMRAFESSLTDAVRRATAPPP